MSRLVDESRNQLRSQAQLQTEQIAGKLRQLGDELHALVDGRPEQAGAVADYARQAVDGVQRVAGRIESRGFDGIVDDIQRFAPRRPGVFLLGAAVAGFGVGRLLRAGALSNCHQAAPATGTDLDRTGELGIVPAPPLADVRDGSVTGMLSAGMPPGGDGA